MVMSQASQYWHFFKVFNWENSPGPQRRIHTPACSVRVETQPPNSASITPIVYYRTPLDCSLEIISDYQGACCGLCEAPWLRQGLPTGRVLYTAFQTGESLGASFQKSHFDFRSQHLHA